MMSSSNEADDEDGITLRRKNDGDGDAGHNVVGESIIRQMTRISQEYGAVNLSQGFPNEPPPYSVRLALVQGVLSGVGIPNRRGVSGGGGHSVKEMKESILRLLHEEDDCGRGDIGRDAAVTSAGEGGGLDKSVTSSCPETSMPVTGATASTIDILNQYSPPMGRADVREAIAAHYGRIYGYHDVDPDTEVTVTLGATEAVASALRAVGRPGDQVVIFEPFHELYPSQCRIFYLDPVYVTLREKRRQKSSDHRAVSNTGVTREEDGETDVGRVDEMSTTTPSEIASDGWEFDAEELKEALSHPKSKILILNTPHNPTGKVFTYQELSTIVTLCLEYQVTIITDEIYEHMIYTNSTNDDEEDGSTNPSTCPPPAPSRHIVLAQAFPEIKSSLFMCNSMGKTASATGWRFGWCLHPSYMSSTYRGVHDQMVVMSPHPQQYAALEYFALPLSYFTSELRERYRHRVALLGRVLREVGFDVPSALMVGGAYYWFVRYAGVPALRPFVGKPVEAAMYMVKNVGVGCVPGDNFYGKDVEEAGCYYLRFAACRSLNDVEEACRRIRAKLGPDS